MEIRRYDNSTVYQISHSSLPSPFGEGQGVRPVRPVRSLRLFILLALLLPTSLLASTPLSTWRIKNEELRIKNSDTAEQFLIPHSSFHFALDAHAFFKDNEYGLHRVDGCTLPGFYLRPKLVWQVEPRVRLEVGAHWLHYWGAHGYPSGTTYRVAQPRWGDSISTMHILPWMQARVNLTPWATLILGSIENTTGHGLPMPLYNRELLYAGDPEAGAQVKIQHRYIDADIWTDWQDFIFNHSPYQELFNAGGSWHLKMPVGRWELKVPAYLIVQHRGGENIDTPIFIHTQTKVNFGTGLGASYHNDDFAAELEVLYLRYKQYRDPTIPFDGGWAFSPTLRMGWKGFGIELNWWDCENFIPLLGSPHYSSKSANTEGVTFDRFQVLSAKLFYTWKGIGPCSVMFEGELTDYLPYTMNRVGESPSKEPNALMVSFGLHIKIKNFVWGDRGR